MCSPPGRAATPPPRKPSEHWTEQRVRGHVAVCVWAAVIETLIAKDLQTAGIADPDQPDQHLTAPRALRELDRIPRVQLTAGPNSIELTTRRSALQHQILNAIGADTRRWDTTVIT